MNILVTGAKGFVGKNLVCSLQNIKEGKDKTHPELTIDEIYEFDIDTDIALLDEYCEKADFVFNLAGVNRPKEQSEFMRGNFGFASTLLDTLQRYKNTCPVMISSSIQAPFSKKIWKAIDKHFCACFFGIIEHQVLACSFAFSVFTVCKSSL